MRFLGNLLWLIFGGFFSAFGWWCAGILWCITVVGIPVGLQCFKLSTISLCPFGKEIVDEGGVGSFLLNILWMIFSGIELAIGNVLIGIILCFLFLSMNFEAGVICL